METINSGATIYVSNQDGDGSSGEAGGGDTRDEDEGGGDDGGDDGDGEGGEEESSVGIGPEAVPPEFREIIQRELTLISRNGVEDGDTQRSSGQLAYRMDGDVMRADDTVTRFSIADQSTHRIEVTGFEDAADAPIQVELAEFSISTKDIPRTRGAARARVTALQDGKKIWSWNVELEQGRKATLNAPERVRSAVIENSPDLLTIGELSLPVRYTAPGANGSTVIEIVLDVEGFGART